MATFSIVIPLRNEQHCVQKLILDITGLFHKENIPYEIVAVNDNSTDDTPSLLEKLAKENDQIRIIHRTQTPGFGQAVKEGLNRAGGEFVAIVMGDESDDPVNIVQYYRELQKGADCVFGSRFTSQSVLQDYPTVKRFANRIGNTLIRCLFLLKFNDVTNAFKAYRRDVLRAIGPLESNDFDITAEIPLKAIAAGYRYATIPIHWYGRTSGASKHRLIGTGKKYLTIVFKIWYRHFFCRTVSQPDSAVLKNREEGVLGCGH
ncbi:MAG: glycosyltransferase family 2 protein [Elusimicrobia bacterium]|nr:glycosyltransferase family 2 protein [Elusimicrobiota bacterium]MBI4218105.1 glycosyltransferase family 2 protein [Elusimicrobiota bacterium]